MKATKTQRRSNFATTSFGMGLLASSILSLSPWLGNDGNTAHAQGLEDSIESELDNMNMGKPADQAQPTAPAPGEPPPLNAEPVPVPQEPQVEAAPPAASTAAPPEAPPEALAEEPPKEVSKPKAKKKKIVAKKKKAKKPADPPRSQEPGIHDEPNLAFEERLYRIFHNAQPVSDETWSEMLGARREDVYHVQPGDTLWDISKTMFGDGFFWSKLWAENRGLENPHRIEKGHGIGFIAGNEEEAPTIAVVEDHFNATPIKINAMAETRGKEPVYRDEILKSASEEEVMRDSSIEVDELIPPPEIPPSKKSRPVTKLPPSFEEPVTIAEDKGYDNSGLDAGKVRSLADPVSIVPTSLLLDRPPQGVGVVEEVEIAEKFAMVGQNVFIRLKRVANMGEKFSVYKETGKIKDAKLGTVGPIVEIGGTVKVIGVINEERHVYRAMVVTSINPVQLGSVVSEEQLPRVSYQRSGTRLSTEVRVIGGEYHEHRRIIGESSVVYLDGGANAGLNPGDLLPVQARRGERRGDSVYPGWMRSIGLLKVAKVEKTVATAIVLEAHEEIQPGDRTGGTMPEAQKIFGQDLDLSKE